jgi:hypothetical protein
METTTALAPVIDTVALAEIIHQAPAILDENTNSHDKAIHAGQNLLQQMEQGMNDQLASLGLQLLAKVKTTLKTCNDRRSPFTRLMSEVGKRFTSLENDLDATKKESTFYQIQEMLNNHAAAKIAEQQKREREAREKLEKEKEKISIESFAENSLRQAVAGYTAEFKRKMNDIFESLTLQNVDHGAEQFSGIEQINPALLPMPQTPNYLYTSREEVAGILVEIRADEHLISELKEAYKTEVVLLRKELIDKLPSKKAELQAIALAGEAERERLQLEADKRKREAELKLAQETEAKAKQAAEDALAKEQAEQLNATVNTQAELFQEAPKVKEGCEIIIKNIAAWQLIFSFWWEREGKTLPADKIEKKTMLQMKSFCESFYIKTGEEIKTQLLEYKITYKAK